METVNGVLLLLVLLADQGSHDLGLALQQDLNERFADRIELVLDPEAGRRLEEFGIETADLFVDSQIGRALTRQQKVVIVHLEDRAAGDDRILNARLWFAGRSDSFVAIAGPDGDPSQDLINGVAHLLRAVVIPEGGDGGASEPPLAALVEREAWEPLLGVLAGRAEKSPREWYYQVLAFVRLRQRDAAVAAVNEFRAAHGDHFLLAAAEAIIPPPQASEVDLQAVMPDSQLPPEPLAPDEPSGRGLYELTEDITVHLDDALRERLEQIRLREDGPVEEGPAPAPEEP